MKRFNILYGKEIPLDEKANNSFFLYHTIHINHSEDCMNPISFCNNSYYSAILFFINSNYLSLEIYQNSINAKTQEIFFNLKRRIKLNPVSLEYKNTSNEDIQMLFLGEKFILIENVLKKSIILDHRTGEFNTILLKGKKVERKNIVYNPEQNSCDDLFKDDSLNSDYKDLSNLNSKNISINKNKQGDNKFSKKKEKNDSSESINMSGDNSTDNEDIFGLKENYSTLKILYVYDEFYQQIIVEKPNQNNKNESFVNNFIFNLGAIINNNDNSTTSNNINTNTMVNPSPNNVSNNNSFVFSKKYNHNVNRIQNQKSLNITNNMVINTDNLETMASNDISGNETKKNTNVNLTNNYTTMNTNMATTLPSSNQNTFDETKILFNTKQNKATKVKQERNYIFMMDKNILYYCIIDSTYNLNKPIEFKTTPFSFDANEIIDQMEIIKVHKDDKISYIFFLLSKSGLFVIPTDFCRSTLKNIIINNEFNRANSFKLYYKLDYAQDPLNYYHMAFNYKNPQNASVYILNNSKLITINLNLFNLKNFIKEELFKLYTKSEEKYDAAMEEKIELENNDIALINKTKKLISFTKQNYSVKKLKILGFITRIKHMDGNFVIFDKLSKSLAIYYFNGEYLDKVENYREVDLIYLFSFNKIFSIFFCMNNTINKISFNKKLYWYLQYFDTFIANTNPKSFFFPSLKSHITEIKERYINGIFNQSDKEIIETKVYKFNKRNKHKIINVKKYCEFCRKEIIMELEKEEEKINNEEIIEEKDNSYYKCLNKNCQTFYCCEIHRDIDYKTFHFFHCKLNQFFLKYEFSTQINFYNDLILLINDIIKYIFNNIKYSDDYLFYLPFIKMLILILKSFNMKVISDRVLEFSQNRYLSKEDLTSLLFYQEVIFYYYNLIILSLNFGQRINLFDFVRKELDFLSEDEEQFFSKSNLTCILFNRNVHFYQVYIDFSQNKKYFFVDKNYLIKSKYLTQNDILFSHLIHLYANYLHLIDKLSKVNQINFLYLNPLSSKILSQLVVFFQERNKESPDNTFIHFLSLISPYFILNRKMITVNDILTKASNLLTKKASKDSLFKAELFHNLGLVQYSKGMFLEGIHNIEKGYELVLDKDYSYLLRIKIVERLALGYLNIGELLKSFILIKQAMEFRINLTNLFDSNSNLTLSKNNVIDKNDYLYQYYYFKSNNISKKRPNYNSIHKKKEVLNTNRIKTQRKGIFFDKKAYYKNSMKIVHLFAYINYIQDFVEYENQLKHMKSKEKKKGIMSKREYQIYLKNYVLAKDDLVTKDKNFNLIDTYCEDYFRAIEFLYSLRKDILKTLDNDNQTKKNFLLNKEDSLNLNQQNFNNNNNPNNKTINLNLSHSIFDENNSSNINKKNNQENINEQNNGSKDKEKNFEYDNEIEIKEDLFEKLSRNKQLTLTSINSKFFNRKYLLRDYFGKIKKNNINYHPIYTEEFKKIISNSKHQYFVKILTQASSLEVSNYFFPTSNSNLEGLSKYLQQEEIQNMLKVEKAKILSTLNEDISNMNNKKNLKDTIKKNSDIIDQESKRKKDQWIINIKNQLLKDPTRFLPEIDSSLSDLYDNINEEYKEEISKNPEHVLYYIFKELTSHQAYTTAIQLKKNELEDDSNILTKTPEFYYKNMKGSKNESKFKRNSFFENSEDENIEEEDKNKRKLNLYEIAGIPEERRLAFSENSSSSDEEEELNPDFYNQNNINNEKKKNELEIMKEVSESDEIEGESK